MSRTRRPFARRRLPTGFTALIGAGLAAGLSACTDEAPGWDGTDAPDPGEAANDAVVDALTASGGQTAAFEIEFAFTGGDGPQGTFGAQGRGSGVYDPNKASLSAEYENDKGDRREAVVIGIEGWHRESETADFYEGKWLRTPAFLAFSGLQPWLFFTALARATEITGNSADGYTALLDLTAQSTAETAAAEGFATGGLMHAGSGVDLTGVVAKLRIDADGRFTEAEVTAADPDRPKRSMRVRYRWTEYGTAVSVKAPGKEETATNGG